jgi:hypothetical protein
LNTTLQILITIVTSATISGIATVLLTKRKEIEFKIAEQKQVRYKSTLVYMSSYFNLNNLKYISGYSDFADSEEILEYLKGEYHAMLLYASSDVLDSLKAFLNSPTRNMFYAVCIAMRNDLWIKKRDLEISNVTLED